MHLRTIVEGLVLSGKKELGFLGSRCLRDHRAVELLVKRWWDLGKLRHRSIHGINAFLKHVANQQIDDVYTLFRILAQEPCKAESLVVKGIDQLAHRLDAT